MYDTWGKLVSIKDGSGNDVTTVTTSVGYKNPYRYRGYRYDTESGLYYCNSRYYNPDWGRFLNADSLAGQVGQLLSHNMFAYCMNNPVNMSDPSGHMATWQKVAICLGVGVAAAVAVVIFAPEIAVAAGLEEGIAAAGAFLTTGATMRDRLLSTIQNRSLWNCANQLYREGAEYGDGGTAAALRYELSQGLGTDSKHWLKAIERIRNLQNILRNQSLDSNDLAIAQNLLKDLQDAVSGK